MSEIAARSCVPCQPQVLAEHFCSRKWREKLNRHERQCHALSGPKLKKPLIKNQMAMNSATYSSRMTTDIPLYESPGASFDGYLEDKPRVFKAIFPDRGRSRQLNEEEWRIQMLPINFLFLTVWPVVEMRLRCKSGGRDYPPGVPEEITKVLELDVVSFKDSRAVINENFRITFFVYSLMSALYGSTLLQVRWKLQGLDNIFQPSEFSLGVKGALYPDRRGARTRLKGQLEMNISFVLPPVLAMVPENVRKPVAETVLRELVENMKRKVNSSLLTDYSKFKQEKPKNRV
ncbi:hypothetical protein OIU85_007616 [Salix viminalis]|uniref:Uncharacterized protein n=1 Tax=Salix viminalis TaxID=40686 RepID=A0A9Q0P9Y9_SALVM|nr:hypothetical protein OIU85_007616 [Salix viminalis]